MKGTPSLLGGGFGKEVNGARFLAVAARVYRSLSLLRNPDPVENNICSRVDKVTRLVPCSLDPYVTKATIFQFALLIGLQHRVVFLCNYWAAALFSN